ncbi:Ser-Thr-rich glycosyl-phosphatidyl-inositol-anchored membrane family-domain-containing protein [Hypoxylon rubiginosum]|uniref:Ser-Thr-rich glycosyl-phosphatidyl-inositol-anchored membrane family-domain-containing protein n=1 Tax=Hypoxylon rubiginosum TaxID=110542 RepID=A0ACB9ZCS4_9PEZI|nr:Ser-Thr-rich glycosyl-phosphatidyl-inositol-anchored membrane family-domain-containing protein [Hypoxylon rubiginosum]
MRSSTVFASALAFAASVFGQTEGYAVMTSPTKGSSVPSGKTFTIEWEAGKFTGPATISLLGGDSPTTLVPGATLGSVDVTAGSFAWDVDCSLGKEKTYGIKITSTSDAGTFQYSFPFAIAGPSCSSGAGSYPTLGSSSSSSEVVSSTSTESSTAATSSTSAPSYPTITSSGSSSVISTSSSIISTSSATTIVISTSSAIPVGNLSTTAVPSYSATTIVTSTSAAVVTPSGSATTTSSVPVATGAANSAAAGSFALVGALAFAVMAM